MRSLADVKREREQLEAEKQERKQYKNQIGEIPVRLWTTTQMLEYFEKVRRKHGLKIKKAFDKRTMFTQLAAIKKLKIKGPAFVEFVHWAERTNEVFPIDIYHLVNQFNRFKKVRKDLFNDESTPGLSS